MSAESGHLASEQGRTHPHAPRLGRHDRPCRQIRAVPRTYALCEDKGVIGRAFYVMDCVEGRVLWEQSLPGISNLERGAICDDMNRVIAALHSTDYAAIGLTEFGKPGNYFARQIGRWSKQYQASETEKIEAMDNLIAWLPHKIPAGDQTAIFGRGRKPPDSDQMPTVR